MPSQITEAFDDTPSATAACGSTKSQLLAQLNALQTEVNNTGGQDKLAFHIQHANPDYTPLQTAIVNFKTAVVPQLTTLSQTITSCTNSNEAVNQLTEKLDNLQNLKATLEQIGGELSTAHTREAVVGTKDEASSFQQTWGMIQRPIQRRSIPILIVFTILFLTAAGAGIWYLSPFVRGIDPSQLGAPGFLQQPVIWFSFVALAIFGVVFAIAYFLRLI